MTVRELWVEGYRSIRALRLSLAPITVVVGPNGCGKTNLYRALRLLNDGRDLAAALMTIQEIGDRALLHESVERAFPSAKLELIAERGTFGFRLAMPGLFRPLEAAELSDGTLRYLCLIAALLSPRTPPFLALNEPETSLHSDLLPALSELIADAGKRGQVLVTTHAEGLATALEERRGTSTIRLSKRDGATVVAADGGPDHR